MRQTIAGTCKSGWTIWLSEVHGDFGLDGHAKRKLRVQQPDECNGLWLLKKSMLGPILCGLRKCS
jgi:hypothetical protein